MKKKIKMLDQRLSNEASTNLRKMTNWQNSQWLRGGADPDNTGWFVNLKKGMAAHTVDDITR